MLLGAHTFIGFARVVMSGPSFERWYKAASRENPKLLYLIREELSGTLGERITRNVRKLVRAEINRALTARDFD